MFDKNISVLVPYKADNGYRDKNLAWIKKRYEILMPNAEICIGHSNIEPFSRSAAINNAAKNATRDIFIIADADIVFDIKYLRLAVLSLSNYTWIIPYSSINYLTVEQTTTLLAKNPNIVISSVDFSDCVNVICLSSYGGYDIFGGISIIQRKHFEQIEGFDERFKGWGCEDDAFQRMMDSICGQHARLNIAIWHLYHMPSPKFNLEKNRELLNNFYGRKDTIIHNFNKSLISIDNNQL